MPSSSVAQVDQIIYLDPWEGGGRCQGVYTERNIAWVIEIPVYWLGDSWGTYYANLVGYEVYSGDPSGPGVVDACESIPTVFPREEWYLGQLIALYTTASDPDYRAAIEYLVCLGEFVVRTSDGWTYTVDVTAGCEDWDGDGTPNLADVDFGVTCTSFRECDYSTPAPLGGGDPISEYDGILPDVPHITGPLEHYFGCVNPVYGNGVVDLDGAIGPSGSLIAQWLSHRWRSPMAMAQPDHPPPYTTAYNLVRAGEGGGVSAYISAPWGKELSYVDRNVGASGGGGSFETLEGTAYWHRYVLIQDYFVIQYYRANDNCWTTIGINYFNTAIDEDAQFPIMRYDPNPHLALTMTISSLDNYVPMTFLPGYFNGEMDSNVPEGEYQAAGYSHNWFWNANGQSFPGGGDGLTLDEVEEGMYNALSRASSGMATDGAYAFGRVAGQGASEATEFILGPGYENEGGNGALDGATSTVDAMGETLGDNLLAALQIDGLSPGTQAAGTFNFYLPRPGGGDDIAFTLSTIPDTSTAMGTALDGLRILLRIALSLWFTWIVIGWYLRLFKEAT